MGLKSYTVEGTFTVRSPSTLCGSCEGFIEYGEEVFIKKDKYVHKVCPPNVNLKYGEFCACCKKEFEILECTDYFMGEPVHIKCPGE